MILACITVAACLLIAWRAVCVLNHATPHTGGRVVLATWLLGVAAFGVALGVLTGAVSAAACLSALAVVFALHQVLSRRTRPDRRRSARHA
jgi:hypothetical protein